MSRPEKDSTGKMKSMIFLLLAFAVSRGEGRHKNIFFAVICCFNTLSAGTRLPGLSPSMQ